MNVGAMVSLPGPGVFLTHHKKCQAWKWFSVGVGRMSQMALCWLWRVSQQVSSTGLLSS